jgi:hypothetical protein
VSGGRARPQPVHGNRGDGDLADGDPPDGDLADGGRTRHLVLNDYGMGGLWWWVWARSPREVVRTYAEVEVVDDPAAVQRVRDWGLEEADVAVPESDPEPLSDLRARRDAQRERPGFGALADRGTVYVRRSWQEDGEEAVFLMELGPDGRRLRQVEVAPDGDALATDPDDWPFNPPFDLHDPVWAPLEIRRVEFEEAWRTARRDEGTADGDR